MRAEVLNQQQIDPEPDGKGPTRYHHRYRETHQLHEDLFGDEAGAETKWHRLEEFYHNGRKVCQTPYHGGCESRTYLEEIEDKDQGDYKSYIVQDIGQTHLPATAQAAYD